MAASFRRFLLMRRAADDPAKDRRMAPPPPKPTPLLRRNCVVVTGLVVVIFAAITFGLWRASTFLLNYRLHDIAQRNCRQMVDRMSNFIEERLTALRYIHHFYVNSDNLSEQEFQGYCTAMLTDAPGILSVMVTDTKGHPTWVAPTDVISLEKIYLMTADPRIDVALSRSLTTLQPAITTPMEVPSYGTGFLAAMPIVKGKLHQGYIVGVFHYNSLLGYLSQPRLMAQFQVTVVQNEKTVFQTPNTPAKEGHGWLAGESILNRSEPVKIILGGQEWSVTVDPVDMRSSPAAAFVSLTILVLGLIISALIGYLVFRQQWRAAILKTEAAQNRTRLERTGLNLVEARSELNLILNSVDEGIILYNNNFDPIQANTAFLTLFNMTDNGVAMQSGTAHHEQMIQLTGSETKYWSLFNSLRNHPEQTYTDELEAPAPPGSKGREKAYLRRASTICGANDEYRGVLAIYKDITTMKAVDRAKDDFLSNVTHELRSPLASIRGFAETLRRDPEMPLETRKEFFSIICDESTRLQDLIEELLDLRRMEAAGAPFNPTAYDFKVLVEDIVRGARTILLSKNITVRLEWSGLYDGRLRGEIAQITRAIHNLLVNAVKYSPEGSEIILNGHCGKQRVWLEITDRGSGERSSWVT
ncbi:MAG: hypothetical protein M1457_06405, partial [bacterium]|nr:hypothetical protein [bacterium]